MITVANDRLTFHFPNVFPEVECDIAFRRTLRTPDDGRTYALPAGLGRFPLRRVEDYAHRLPKDSVRRSGVVMPIYQAEALWLAWGSWSLYTKYPCAIKVATGKVCAVSGEPWEDGLRRNPQNYVIVPFQPWLDGYCVEKGKVRQFVAMPLGGAHTAEEQVTGEAVHGGLQLAVYPMKREVYKALTGTGWQPPEPILGDGPLPPRRIDVGVAPGGLLSQEVYEDGFGLEAWDQEQTLRCFVTLANAEQWMAITGERPPTKPPTARDYAMAGLPWFLHYDADREALDGSEKLAGLTSAGEAIKATEAENWSNEHDYRETRAGNSLTSDQREIFLMHRAEVPIEEMAEKLGLSLEAMNKALSRVFDALRRAMADDASGTEDCT